MRIPNVIRQHKAVTALVIVAVTPILVFTIWTFVALNFSYSTGTRGGYLQKISKRGWVCKTWEGELQTTAVPGSAPETFHFSTRSDSVAAELNKVTGQRVTIDYQQHRGVPGSCFGETEYFVTGVRPVGTL